MAVVRTIVHGSTKERRQDQGRKDFCCTTFDSDGLTVLTASNLSLKNAIVHRLSSAERQASLQQRPRCDVLVSTLDYLMPIEIVEVV